MLIKSQKNATPISVEINSETINIGPNGYLYKPITENEEVKINFENSGTKDPDPNSIAITIKTSTGNIKVS